MTRISPITVALAQVAFQARAVLLLANSGYDLPPVELSARLWTEVRKLTQSLEHYERLRGSP